MSGGAIVVAYRTDNVGMAERMVSVPRIGNAAASPTGAAVAQALRQADASMAPPQQSSAGGSGWFMLPMLSHGVAFASAQEVATGPIASQTVSKAARKVRRFIAGDRVARAPWELL
jgi:hypothetical protein